MKHPDAEKSWQVKSPITDTIDIRKSDDLHNNGASVNDFCTRNYPTTDDKIQAKNVVDFPDDEPVSSTIHNDITQKLVQKKQNDNQITKNHNSYDKKLNQPNIKPSVSNVFNSLNEYINASTTNMENISCSIDCIKDRNGKFMNNTGKINETSTNDTKLSKHAVPAYQNILLPVKCEPCGVGPNPDIDNEINEPGSSSGNNRKLIPADCSDHIYENINFGKNLGKSRPPRAPEPSRSSSQDETKHIYENIDFKPCNDENSIYECIYIGNKHLPETTTELEKAAKRLTEQFPDNMGTIDRKLPLRDIESPGSADSTTLVFQNVNLNVPTERKPVGFSTIDDLSEDELSKYLAELEAEERANEEAVMYENVSVPGPSSSNILMNTSKDQTRTIIKHTDEDANEAPIFESVTIGELPRVSEEKLQEKAKKFRVIDYSKSGTSAESNFLETTADDKFTEHGKVIHEVKGNNCNASITKSGVNDNVEMESEDEQGELKVSKSKETGDLITGNAENNGQIKEDNVVIDEECGTETSGSSNEKEIDIGGSDEDNTTENVETSETVVADNVQNEESVKVEENIDKSLRPQTLDIVSSVNMDDSSIIGDVLF